jgi:hypothetical protein
MNPGMIAGVSAVSGSIVGAMGSIVGNWMAQWHHDWRELLGRKLASREALYSDFITESARLLVDAEGHSSPDLQKLIPVYGLLSRIRLSSSSTVLQSAEQVVRHILDTYPKPNLTSEQIQSRALSAADPLRTFSDICRAELESMQKHIFADGRR